MTIRVSPNDGLVLAVDLGTTNVKALLVDPATRRIVRRGSVPVDVHRPADGWVEQDGEQLWGAVCGAVAECLADGAVPVGIAISNQRESVAVWTVDGGLLGPVLGWQDARTAAWCADPAQADLARIAPDITGLTLDPMFSAPKLRWLLDRHGGVPGLRLGTLDTWLVDRLTGEFLAEAGNASRTLLLDLATLDYSPELLAGFGIPRSVLAPVVASDAGFGVTREGLPVPAGVPVVAVLADSHAALYLHGSGRPGEGKVTYGTGSSIMVSVPGAEAPAPLAEPVVARTLAWQTDVPVYAYEGNIVASGAALEAMARILTGGDVGALDALARTVGRGSGLSFVPAFTGLAAPWFDRGAVPLLAGITGATTPGHVALAAFEAVAHQVGDVIAAVDRLAPGALTTVHADGGATASALLMQLQADVLGRPLHVAAAPEASALGVAALAARALDLPVAAAEEGRQVHPDPTQGWVSTSRARWRDAIGRSRGHAVHRTVSASEG
ncbi:FGGY family carbohydrate kinase [Tessaracoccus defluvii]|uniref:Glycerol kinase n=1 Tax=Tessaracoccus defluvii TaxID=1285901 RepID=A0A7H0H346_9ACTN|nr:FGGY family carbohydrate kinase [Tessaracoccus defluvii]QNP54962.1 glycerol kinase [Tessaracoccus defluvii]